MISIECDTVYQGPSFHIAEVPHSSEPIYRLHRYVSRAIGMAGCSIAVEQTIGYVIRLTGDAHTEFLEVCLVAYRQDGRGMDVTAVQFR